MHSGHRSADRKMERKEKQRAKKERRQKCAHYEEVLANKTKFICCDKLMCMSHYKCSFLTKDNVPLIQFYRNKFLEFGRETKRIFIANRLKSKNPEIGLKTSEYYLENIETMKYYVSQGVLPLQPSCAPQQMVKVCNAFFRVVLQVSQNKLYQPTVEGDFSTSMNITRNMYCNDYSVDDSITRWLVNYAEAHLHDPSKGHTIILSVPSRKLCTTPTRTILNKDRIFIFHKK